MMYYSDSDWLSEWTIAIHYFNLNLCQGICCCRADTNRDGSLELDELKDWIMLNVKIHLNEAIMDNKRVFAHLDTNNDGIVI